MKRFLSSSFIALALIISVAGAAPTARAAVGASCSMTDQSNCVASLGESCDLSVGKCVSPGQSSNNNNIPGSAALNQQPGQGCSPADSTSCGSGYYCDPTSFTCVAQVDLSNSSQSNHASDPAAQTPAAGQLGPPTTPEAGLNGIMAWIASLFAWLAGVAMVTLNYAVYFTVVTMGDYVHKLNAVGVTWRIMRDIGNIVLIFGFLAIGITTILNVDWYGGGKKMLPMMFVAAVFLNFSLFLSEAVIDTGNLFATQFYTQINGGRLPTSDTIGSQGVSDKIMNQLGLTTIYGQVKDSKNSALYAANPMFIGFMSIILFIILAFVLFSLAFILIARFVILLFLIIIAPIGFAGLAVPQLKSSADRWWHMLFEQTITAPVLLLLLYIALAVITDANFLTSGGKPPEWLGLFGKDGATNIAGFATAILSFLVAMGLLLAVVIISKRLSAFGAAGATKLAGKLSGVSLAAAAPGWAGRHTVGLGANYAAKKLRGTAFGKSFVGRGFADTLEKKVAGASFDLRNTGLGKSASGIGLDLGKGQKGGYKADLEERVKSYERAAAGITGDSKKAKEEKDVARQAREKLVDTTKVRDEAMAEYNNISPALKQENDSRKAEVDRLEKDKEKAGIGTHLANDIDKQLIPAQKSLEESEIALKAANDKLTSAETARATAMSKEKEARGNVGTAKKEAQNEYADRLENKWGPVWVFGTAAAAAAPRVRSNIGKTADQRAIEALLKGIEEKSGGRERGGGREGGTKEEKEEK